MLLSALLLVMLYEELAVKTRFFWCMTFMTLMLLLVGCTSGNTAPPPAADDADADPVPTQAVTQAVDGTPYPIPARPTSTLPDYPLPASASPTLGPTVDAQQFINESMGAIEGILLDLNDQPIVGIRVFVATISPGPTPDAPVISFTLDSLSGGTDASGRFVIGEIEAGTYSLAFWTPARASLIPAPNGEKDSAIQVEVSNDQVTNVGTIRIERP